jgi:hypothetical protein
MNKIVQQTFDLGPRFREVADRTVPLVIDGQCFGKFVNPELREQSMRAIERSALLNLQRTPPACRWIGGAA